MTFTIELSSDLAANKTAPPDRLGIRFDAEKFLPEEGNTIVCHLDHTAPAASAVLKARERMQALPEADCLLFTPAESLHMTLIEGVIETRRTADAWPADIAKDASIETVTEYLLPRFKAFSPPQPFRVKASGMRAPGLFLEGATRQDEATMRAWRDALTEPFGYRRTTHESYRFHMTFAYVRRWIPNDLRQHWETELHAILSELVEAAPIIPLTPPAFCRFADMTWFEELLAFEA